MLCATDAEIQERYSQSCLGANRPTVECRMVNPRLRVHACSVVFDSLWPHRLYPTRLLCPWDSPGKNTGVGCHFHLQGIFLTQGSNPGFLCLVEDTFYFVTVYSFKYRLSYQNYSWDKVVLFPLKRCSYSRKKPRKFLTRKRHPLLCPSAFSVITAALHLIMGTFSSSFTLAET